MAPIYQEVAIKNFDRKPIFYFLQNQLLHVLLRSSCKVRLPISDLISTSMMIDVQWYQTDDGKAVQHEAGKIQHFFCINLMDWFFSSWSNSLLNELRKMTSTSLYVLDNFKVSFGLHFISWFFPILKHD